MEGRGKSTFYIVIFEETDISSVFDDVLDFDLGKKIGGRVVRKGLRRRDHRVQGTFPRRNDT